MILNIKYPPIILIDGSFYMHRAYHAYPSLTTKNGQPTWMIYGVLNMIKSLLKQYKPTHMAIVFDAPGKNFRHDLYEKYKKNRPTMPLDLLIQINPLYETIKAIGIPIFCISNVEADDVIGTLAKFLEKLGKQVIVSTGDKDIAQIVSSNITLINTMSKEFFNPEKINKKFGVPPNLIIDYLALIGDYSDNIPGVPRIGKKTARLLLNKIGNLKNLYNQLNKIETLKLKKTKSIIHALINHKKTAFLSYNLAKIKTDVKLEISPDYNNFLLIKKTNINHLMSLFKKFEFKKWINILQSEGTWI